MKYPQQTLFSEDVSYGTSDDDIDTLFSQLQTLEPPESLVQNILHTVAHVPLSQTASSLWDRTNGLLVCHEHLEPS